MYILDTCAIIEIIQGNEKFEKYFESSFIVNDFIITELAYYLIRTAGFDVANYFVSKYSLFSKPVDNNIILEAMKLRYKYKKRKLSMVDCISYIMAKKLNMKLLTKDSQMKDFKHVEFVN